MAADKTLSSTDLKGLLKRVKAGKLTPDDQVVLAEILGNAIKLRQLVEKAKVIKGGKKVLASLPFGFDIVK
jgi:DNA mismatch repair ATPase MutS